MPKIYILSHIHDFGDGTSDMKMVGVFTSREKARRALRDASDRPGFRDAAEGFRISEYPIQGVGLHSVERTEDEGDVHLLRRISDHPEEGETVFMIGAFYSEESAEQAKGGIENLGPYEFLEVSAWDFDVESWLEGYATIYCDENGDILEEGTPQG